MSQDSIAVGVVVVGVMLVIGVTIFVLLFQMYLSIECQVLVVEGGKEATASAVEQVS